ncbi:MAG: acetyl-CoA carboxylase carboxyltransferase subunit alpha [Candidatus Izemoplasmatales bacterium]|nr:acetyl-CoA carboxylase carboxyltransferase subunit alpha [Candidatus Izemoplasmatales bacterium]
MCPIEPAWKKVQYARHPLRPTAKKVIEYLAPDFVELKGDRLYANDEAIVGGIGSVDGYVMTIIAEEKGTSIEERIRHHFGMPHPEGYRKAMRLAKQAEKFQRPVLFLIDTPGAYPGVEAEERGQAEAIATSIKTLFSIKTPIVSVILSEGGSGGALAIGIADYLIMMENATYSILSPEGFAAILYKDASLAKDVADTMKLTAADILHFGVIDEIIPEPEGGWHREVTQPMPLIKQAILKALNRLKTVPLERLIETRIKRYRKMGLYFEDEESQ